MSSWTLLEARSKRQSFETEIRYYKQEVTKIASGSKLSIDFSKLGQFQRDLSSLNSLCNSWKSKVSHTKSKLSKKDDRSDYNEAVSLIYSFEEQLKVIHELQQFFSLTSSTANEAEKKALQRAKKINTPSGGSIAPAIKTIKAVPLPVQGAASKLKRKVSNAQQDSFSILDAVKASLLESCRSILDNASTLNSVSLIIAVESILQPGVVQMMKRSEAMLQMITSLKEHYKRSDNATLVSLLKRLMERLLHILGISLNGELQIESPKEDPSFLAAILSTILNYITAGILASDNKSDEEKKDWLRKLYPDISDERFDELINSITSADTIDTIAGKLKELITDDTSFTSTSDSQTNTDSSGGESSSGGQDSVVVHPQPTPNPDSIHDTTLDTSNIDAQFLYNWHGEHVTPEFMERVVEISEELGISPDDLMAVMGFESLIDPAAVNKSTTATGLIQFMPSTARGLGTTVEELAKMSAVEQLDYVYAYLKPYAGKMETLSDIYMAVLWPAAVGKPDSDILFDSSPESPTAGTYALNAGLDKNDDGVITKGEATEIVIQRRDKYYGLKESE